MPAPLPVVVIQHLWNNLLAIFSEGKNETTLRISIIISTSIFYFSTNCEYIVHIEKVDCIIFLLELISPTAKIKVAPLPLLTINL